MSHPRLLQECWALGLPLQLTIECLVVKRAIDALAFPPVMAGAVGVCDMSAAAAGGYWGRRHSQ